jgi:hypothetical protein
MMKKNCNTDIKAYYDKYCKILKKVITAGKKMAYDNYCIKTHNKMKSTGKLLIWRRVELLNKMIPST